MEDRRLPITVGRRGGRASRHARAAAVRAGRRHHAAGPAGTRRCATASASSTGSTTTRGRTCAASSPLGRMLGVDDRRRPARRRSPPRRARTPRVADRLLKRVRDFAEVHAGGAIDAAIADDALDLLEVDREGLDRLDRESCAVGLRGGSPAGRSACRRWRWRWRGGRHDRGRLYEPYLSSAGSYQRTPRRRCATTPTLAHLGLGPLYSPWSLFGAWPV